MKNLLIENVIFTSLIVDGIISVLLLVALLLMLLLINVCGIITTQVLLILFGVKFVREIKAYSIL